MEKSLAQSIFSVEGINTTNNFYQSRNLSTYRKEIIENRQFARNGVSAAIVNRICDVSTTRLYNRKLNSSDEELAYFDHILSLISEIVKQAIYEYLVSGFCLIDYSLDRIVGSKIDKRFGKKRLFTPTNFFVRDPMTLDIGINPANGKRVVYLEIPFAEQEMIRNGGVYENGVLNKDVYRTYEQNFPDFVRLVKSGITKIMLKDRYPILRKPTSYDPYPQPYLTPALESLRHKDMLKKMDYLTAQRAQEAIRHIKMGNDRYPVTEDDPALVNISQQIKSRPNISVYNLFTNHTVEISWVYPPLDALLSDKKYEEPNADIFLSLGFSRALLVGEMQRSNTGGASLANLGPLAIIQDVRLEFMKWVRFIYDQLADYNNFKNRPDPRFIPVRTSDFVSMLIYALSAMKEGVISRDVVANLFDTVYREEYIEIDREVEMLPDSIIDEPMGIETVNQQEEDND
jgi:hypothetical protein